MIPATLIAADARGYTPISIFKLPLEVGEELQGFDGAELVDVEFADPVGQFVVDGFEELDLDGGFFGDEVFVLGQDLAGAFDYAHGQRGQAGYFDAVAAVGCAGFDLAEEQDLIAGFFYGDVQVADAFHLIG
jgi:hypothetical protein